MYTFDNIDMSYNFSELYNMQSQVLSCFWWTNKVFIKQVSCSKKNKFLILINKVRRNHCKCTIIYNSITVIFRINVSRISTFCLCKLYSLSHLSLTLNNSSFLHNSQIMIDMPKNLISRWQKISSFLIF